MTNGLDECVLLSMSLLLFCCVFEELGELFSSLEKMINALLVFIFDQIYNNVCIRTNLEKKDTNNQLLYDPLNLLC